MTLSKEKIVNLMKHVAATKDRLAAPVPKKHEAHPDAYRDYLQREITAAQATIDAAKLEGTGK